MIADFCGNYDVVAVDLSDFIVCWLVLKLIVPVYVIYLFTRHKEFRSGLMLGIGISLVLDWYAWKHNVKSYICSKYCI